MSRIRVAVLDDYQRVAMRSADWSPVRERGEVVAFHDRVEEDEDLVRRLSGFDVVVLMRERTMLHAGLLRRLPDLKLVVTPGMRDAHVDLAVAGELGITVSGTEGSSTGAAEHTWALLMALLRKVPAADRSVRSGGWQSTFGVGLAGKTLGIVGLGNLGRRVAGYAEAFDMPVVAWSQNLTSGDASRAGAELVSKEELFDRSTVVCILTRLSDRTIGLVGASDLERLGPSGYLVNTSRGPIVDEKALLAALRDGAIAGAALDVYETEPLPLDHPLRSSPRTVLTPHIGYVTDDIYRDIYRGAVEDIVAWYQGAPMRVIGAGSRGQGPGALSSPS